MALVNSDKKSKIIYMIEKLLDDGYDEIDVDTLIEIYKTNKKAGCS
ncbi:hypothetical protein LAV44_09305 [Clostridium sporogenes]|nr:hypothetical protein [Clostridium sporogenes]MCW6075524.1 hypothetical protein [Clostridium sporogenes]